MRYEQAYCPNCKMIVEILDGYYYKKCSKCYKPVKPENTAGIVTIAVLLGILTLILLFSSLVTI